MSASPFTPQERDAELLSTAEAVDYKKPSEGEPLKLHLFSPRDDSTKGACPVILFFFGSGFDRGSLTQFAPQALHFSHRGAVSALVEYRTARDHGATPLDAMRDATSAIRWVRSNATTLGIDPSRLTAAGALAGATIAATAAMKNDLKPDLSDPANVDGTPNAVVLFSPLLDIQKGRYGAEAFEAAGIPLKEGHLSSHLARGLPPTLILHGTADREIPFETVTQFVRKSRRKQNRCDLVPFENRRHSFYNLNVDPVLFDLCNTEMDHFLVSEGFLDSPPRPTENVVSDTRDT